MSLVQAQHLQRQCGVDNTLREEFRTNQKLRQEILETENRVKVFAQSNSVASSIYTIPVIVHVLYHTVSENVADSQIVKMLQIMNEDFGRTNPDTINTPAAFLPDAHASSFQFCFATHDSLGNASTGIEHIYTDTLQFSSPWAMQTHGVAAWNTDEYFNVWIGNALDFSYDYCTPVSIYPTYHAGFGVMVDYNYISRLQLGDTSQYSGRGLTHALGHCFNLLHPFDFVTCSDADSLSDTPIQNSASYFCQQFPYYDNCNTTFPGIQFMNFMDLNDETCMNMFTHQQQIRMLASMTQYYPDLLFSSTACLPLGVGEMNLKNVKIFPNPSTGVFNVVAESVQFSSYDVRDFCGKVVCKSRVSEGAQLNIDLSSFPAGIYFLSLQDARGNVAVRKLIKAS